jgi:hypothetical protein
MLRTPDPRALVVVAVVVNCSPLTSTTRRLAACHWPHCRFGECCVALLIVITSMLVHHAALSGLRFPAPLANDTPT